MQYYILANKHLAENDLKEKLSIFFRVKVEPLSMTDKNAPINFCFEDYHNGEFKFEIQIFGNKDQPLSGINIEKCCQFLAESFDIKAAYTFDEQEENYRIFEKDKPPYVLNQKDLNLEGKDIEFIKPVAKQESILLYDGIDPLFAPKKVMANLPIAGQIVEIGLVDLIKKFEIMSSIQLIAWNGIADKLVEKFQLIEEEENYYKTRDGEGVAFFCFLNGTPSDNDYFVCIGSDELQPGRFRFTLEGIWLVNLINIDKLEIIYLSVPNI